MHMSLAQWLMAAAAPAMQLALLCVLIKRGLKSRFPIFFNYVIYNLLSVVFILLVGPRLSSSLYSVAYWVITAVGVLIIFGVLYEAFVNILKPYSALIDLGKMLFAWAGLFMLLASSLTAIATTGHRAAKLCAAILLFERSLQLLQCGILFLFLVFQNRLGLSWRSEGMCVALGLGTYAALDLVSVALRGSYPSLGSSLDTANACLFLINWGFWATTFMLTEPERKSAADSPKRLVLQRWNEALVAYGYSSPSSAGAAPSPVESFLPGIEKTVDRVLARKIAQ